MAAEIHGTIEYAGFWRRVLANILDSFFLCVPYFALVFLFFDRLIDLSFHTGASIVFQIVLLFAYVAYFAGFLVTRWQATPGKRLMEVYVGRPDGSPISIGRSIGRYAALHVPTYVLLALFLIAMLLAGGWPHMPGTAFSAADQARFNQLTQKQFHRQALTPEETQFMDGYLETIQKNNMHMIAANAHLSPAAEQRLEAIQKKLGQKQPLTTEEKQFNDAVMKRAAGAFTKWIGWGMLTWSYLILVAFMIGLTEQKTGPHDLIAKTRAFRGVLRSP